MAHAIGGEPVRNGRIYVAPSERGAGTEKGSDTMQDDLDAARFRCRVGHGFSSESLVALQRDDVEAARWTAYLALEERAALCHKLAAWASERQHRHATPTFEDQAADAERRAQLLRGVLRLAASAPEPPAEGSPDQGSRGATG